MKLNESRKLAINHPSIICCSTIKICVVFRLGKVFGEWQELHVHLLIHLFMCLHFALPRVLTETSPEVRGSLLRKVQALLRIKQNLIYVFIVIALALSIMAYKKLSQASEFSQTILSWGKNSTLWSQGNWGSGLPYATQSNDENASAHDPNLLS